MNSSESSLRYGGIAQTAHWLTALLLACGWSLGFYMADLPVSPLRLKLFSYHKWIGVTVFVVVALRLAWRLVRQPPALPPMPEWERRAAEISHHLLYLLVLLVPLSGWLMSSAKGFQTVWLGLLPIPDLLHKNPPLGAALTEVHFGLNVMLLAVVGLHVAAAFKHLLLDRDQVMQRMLPGRARKESLP